MQRIQINRMPLYSVDGENIIGRVSAYRLSHIASYMKFYKPSLRYPNRLDRIKSNVLRALCDRYPSVWPSLKDIADKANCSPAQARRALRELEFQDRLIVDINSRLTWRWPTTDEIQDGHPAHIRILDSDRAGKKGGWGKNAGVQYFICDRKIYDIYHHQQEWEAHEKGKRFKNRTDGHPTQRSKQAQSGERNHGTEQPTQGSMTARSWEHESPLAGDSNRASPPSPLIAEPTNGLTDQKNLPPNMPENLWGRMALIWKTTGKGIMNRAGWKQIETLPEKYGLGQETLANVFASWVAQRDLHGLLCPLIKFAEEFPDALAAYESIQAEKQRLAEDERFVEEQIAAQRRQLGERLAEIAVREKHDAEHAEDIGV